MDWKQFSKATKEAMDANDAAEMGFTFQADVYEGLSCCDFNEFLTSFGGAYFGNPKKNLFGPVGERPVTVAEQPVVDSLKMVRTFIHGSSAPNTLDGYEGGISPPAVLQWTEEPSRKPFTNGKAVMHRNWPYSININGAEDVFGEDLGVMPIPYGVPESEAKYPMTGGPVAALGGWHVALNPNAANKAAALEVIKAFTKPDVQLAMFGLIGWIPPRPPLLDSSEAKEVPVIGRYVEQLKVAGENAIPRPVTVVWPQESAKIAQEANAAMSGDKSPTKAMTDLKSSLEQIESSV
jgi:ABC-type glycerol-3-phosphate transport system substrate-binding protein